MDKDEISQRYQSASDLKLDAYNFVSDICNEEKSFLHSVPLINEPVMVAIDQMAKRHCREAKELEEEKAEALKKNHVGPKFDCHLNTPVSYLCTGKVAFCVEEPSLMSSMALVHSRIRCVVFIRREPLRGALVSNTYLQDQPGTNHHFSVYECVL
jgi:hypothetical protein